MSTMVDEAPEEDDSRIPLALIEPPDISGYNTPAIMRASVPPTPRNAKHEVAASNIVLNRCYDGETQIKWGESPKTVLIIKKIHDPAALHCLRTVAEWLLAHGCRVIVEPAVQKDECPEYQAYDPENPGKGVDFCVCFGGDGTLLHLNSVFQDRAIPPLISFALGSLGFLTPFDFDDWQPNLERLLNAHVDPVMITLRMRIVCEIYRREDMNNAETSFTVLNEVLVDRGSHPFLSSLELFIDADHVTTVAADGLLISTPTGSTAYSMSAGGAMVAPALQAILLTPICPHSLSFRPIIVPDTCVVELVVPEDARSAVCASFDGRNRIDLRQGDSLVMYASAKPLTTIKQRAFNHEWFVSIQQKLHWNIREKQKPFTPAAQATQNGAGRSTGSHMASPRNGASTASPRPFATSPTPSARSPALQSGRFTKSPPPGPGRLPRKGPSPPSSPNPAGRSGYPSPSPTRNGSSKYLSPPRKTSSGTSTSNGTASPSAYGVRRH